MLKRKYQVEVLQGEHSVDIVVACSERIGTGWVWRADMPGVSLLPFDDDDAKSVLKDALVAIIEHL